MGSPANPPWLRTAVYNSSTSPEIEWPWLVLHWLCTHMLSHSPNQVPQVWQRRQAASQRGGPGFAIGVLSNSKFLGSTDMGHSELWSSHFAPPFGISGLSTLNFALWPSAHERLKTIP